MGTSSFECPPTSSSGRIGGRLNDLTTKVALSMHSSCILHGGKMSYPLSMSGNGLDRVGQEIAIDLTRKVGQTSLPIEFGQYHGYGLLTTRGNIESRRSHVFQTSSGKVGIIIRKEDTIIHGNNGSCRFLDSVIQFAIGKPQVGSGFFIEFFDMRNELHVHFGIRRRIVGKTKVNLFSFVIVRSQRWFGSNRVGRMGATRWLFYL